jgi:hypothetical protein
MKPIDFRKYVIESNTMGQHRLEQGSATYGTRDKRGTRKDFQWHDK